MSSARKSRLKRGNSKIKTTAGPGGPYKPPLQRSESRASAAGAAGAAAPARRSSTGTPTKLRRSKTSDEISDNGDDKTSLLRQFIDEVVATTTSIY